MPKGGVSSFVPVHAGVQDDLNNFLRKFLKKKCFLFTDFRDLFSSEGMIAMFNGRTEGAEKIEFNENLLCTCAEYINPRIGLCGPVRPYEERLFGLYAVYIFYYLQPKNHVVQIRMDPDGVRTLYNFMRYELLVRKQWDAYACVLNLINDDAIRIVAFVKFHDPTTYRKFDVADRKAIEQLSVANANAPMSGVTSLVEDDLMQELLVAHKVYNKAREKMCASTIFNLDDPKEAVEMLLHRAEKVHDIRCKKTANMKHYPGHMSFVENEPRRTRSPNRTLSVSSQDSIEERGFKRQHIKDKAYKSDISYSRTRRYQNPKATESELMAGVGLAFVSDDEVEVIKSIKNPKAEGVPQPADKEPKEEEDSQGEKKPNVRSKLKGKGRKRTRKSKKAGKKPAPTYEDMPDIESLLVVSDSEDSNKDDIVDSKPRITRSRSNAEN